MLIRLVLCIFLCVALCFAGCSATKNSNGRRVALIRAQDVELLTVNGTLIDRASRAVLVVAGRNELTFKWPVYREDFRIPIEYRVIMHATADKEYVITPHPKSGFLCAWESSKAKGIDFTRHAGCVQRQPT